jgi:hypothetical protein
MKKKMSRAPVCFEGSVERLFEEHIKENLPSPATVSAFHTALVSYSNQPDPLFLLRAVSVTTRAQTYATSDGTRFRATDNAPVWWTHYQLFHDRRFGAGDFEAAIDTIPAHMFDIARAIPESANTYGWHFAHVYDVKDRRVDWFRWTRADVVRRFMRNIHPCNVFLLPKTEWQRWGGDSRVLAFIRCQYAQRYSGVWSEFVQMAGHFDKQRIERPGSFIYLIGERGVVAPQDRRVVRREPVVADHTSAVTEPVAAQYSSSRLLFRASVIEALGPDQRFRIQTPVGLFEMSKREFYEAFPRVVQTASYQDRGVYHFPQVPRAALPFLVR